MRSHHLILLSSSVFFSSGQGECTTFHNAKCPSQHLPLDRDVCFVSSLALTKPKTIIITTTCRHGTTLSVHADEPIMNTFSNLSERSINKSFNARSVAIAALSEVSHRQNSGKDPYALEPQYYVRKLEADPQFLLLQDQRDRSFARSIVGTTGM